jgi:hypothetical protein
MGYRSSAGSSVVAAHGREAAAIRAATIRGFEFQRTFISSTCEQARARVAIEI